MRQLLLVLGAAGLVLASCTFLFDTERLATSTVTEGGASDSGSLGDGPPPQAPPQAIDAGFTHLAYSSDDGWDIGLDGVDGSHAWYRAQFFGGMTTPSSIIDVDAGVLTFGCAPCSGGAIGSAAPGPHQHAYQHGYFEATLRFDPTLGLTSNGYPAWWSASLEHSNGTDVVDAAGPFEHFGAIDFMEAVTAPGGDAAFGGGAYHAAVHAFSGVYGETCPPGYCETQNAPGDTLVVDAGTQWNAFHTYGCLWVPGSVTWYFDDHEESRVTWQSGDPYSIIDSQHLVLELTVGSNWPVTIKSVRVWQ
jgi:hypothetical protein